MKKTITLLSFLLVSYVVVHAQVSVFKSNVANVYWLTFMLENNRPSGDLLYYKSHLQPASGVNSYDVTIGRYKFATSTETMSITLQQIEGFSASLFFPSQNGIATDNQGNIYVSSYGSMKIYRYNAPSQNSGSITLSPSAIYTIPTGDSAPKPLAIDGSGNLFIGDGSSKVYKILNANLANNVTLSTAFITIPYGSGSAYDIDFDGPGNLYISNVGKNILKYSPTGTLLSTITYNVGNTTLSSATVADNGTIFFSSGNNSTIAKYDPVSNTTSLFAGASGSSGDAIDPSTTPPYNNARFYRITNLVLGGNGMLLAYDESNKKIYKIVPGAIEATLPLFLTNFNVSVAANAANYKWTMASQADVAKYVIQSSTDGKTFKEITTVLPVQDKLNYTYADNSFQTGTYVRLKIVYGNGEEEFSDVQFIKNELDKNQFQAGLTISRLTIKNEIPGNYTIKIIDLNGRVVFNEARFLEKGSNFISLNYGIVNNANLYVINCIGTRQNYSVKTIVN